MCCHVINSDIWIHVKHRRLLDELFCTCSTCSASTLRKNLRGCGRLILRLHLGLSLTLTWRGRINLHSSLSLVPSNPTHHPCDHRVSVVRSNTRVRRIRPLR